MQCSMGCVPLSWSVASPSGNIQESVPLFTASPRSRGLTVPAAFLDGGHGIPRGVEAQRVADQQVIRLEPRELCNCFPIYPELDQSDVGKQGQHHGCRWHCGHAFVAWELLVMRTQVQTDLALNHAVDQ